MMSKKKKKKISREEARKLYAKGWGLIDTSCRTRSLKEKSTVALASDSINHTVFCKARIKREVFNKFCDYYIHENLKVLMHATVIHNCLVYNIHKLPGVFICADGFHPDKLYNHLKQMLGKEITEEKIIVLQGLKSFFGKKNKADRLAAKVNSKDATATIKFTESDFSTFLKAKIKIRNGKKA